MIRRPPRSTLTDTLFLYTTLFRSGALDLIRERGIEPDIVAYLDTPPSPAELRELLRKLGLPARDLLRTGRSEEHTSELQSLMRISYAVFRLKKKTYNTIYKTGNNTNSNTLVRQVTLASTINS